MLLETSERLIYWTLVSGQPLTLSSSIEYKEITRSYPAPALQQVNQAVLISSNPAQVEVDICRAEELERRRGLTSELDEMWAYIAKKANPRWLWHAIDHHSGQVL